MSQLYFEFELDKNLEKGGISASIKYLEKVKQICNPLIFATFMQVMLKA
jgi:hypothetical protein